MKVSIIIENTSENKYLTAEHGLSLYIEYEGNNYLLDTGATGIFVQNADNMGIDLNNVDYCILSHGHYDHAGGLNVFFENYKKNVYAMNTAVDDYYSGSAGVIHEIGIPKDVLNKHKKLFSLVNHKIMLTEKVYLLPHKTDGLEKIGERAKLYKTVDGELQPDNFSHELSLVFDTDKGLIVFNSCSHAGITNIINEVTAEFPNKKIYVFFGGLHMKGKCGDEVICTFTEEEIKEIADYLNDVGLEKLYTGHCTGEPAIKLLKKYLGDKVEVMSTGMKICI